MDDQSALKRFYELLVNVLQVIVTIVMSCGLQNEHVRTIARNFLSENRALMVGVFKRQARIVAYQNDSAEADAQITLGEAAELYVLLISLTGFMQVGLKGPQKTLTVEASGNGIKADDFQVERLQDVGRTRRTAFT